MTPFRFGLHYYRKNIPLAIIAQLMSFIALTADLLLPLMMELFIDYVICENVPDPSNIFYFLLDGSKGDVHTMKLFLNLTLFFMAFLAVRLVFIYVKAVINQVLGLRMETILRDVTYRKLMELDSQTISGFNSGELLQTVNSDTIMYKDMFCHIYPSIIDSVFVLCVSIGVLFGMNPWLLLIPGLLTPVFAVALQKFKKQAKENYMNIRKNNSGMNLAVQENIEAVRLVRAFTNEEFEKQKFDISNESLKQSHLKQIGLSARFEVLFSSLKQIGYIGTIAVGAILVIQGKFYVGYLVACANYVMKIIQYVTQINNSIFTMQQMNVAGQKMMNFMATESKVHDKGLEGAKNPLSAEEMAHPDIKVENLNLTIEGKEILKDINLDIPYGKKLGIAGSTGSGKSMLLETLMRNFELTEGKVTINGTDCRDIPLADLRAEYATVFQEAFLFSNTVSSNIQFTDDVYTEQKSDAEDRMLTASRNAQAHGFIEKMPLKYDTIVGERGIGISGGQKQRLSIARALYKNSPVLVMDDSTSALDIETEKALLKDLNQFYPEKTLLITAHRLSSVAGCDEIIYLQDGKIVERGTFQELMELNGHFATVYNIQEAQNRSVMNFTSELKAGELQGFAERIGRKVN